MGQFYAVALSLAAIIDDHISVMGRISTRDLSEIISQATPSGLGEINCYPGVAGYDCCEIAFFISLSYKCGRGHLSFRQALEKLVQHMQGRCSQVTKNAVLFTDSWEPAAYNDWRHVIEKIQEYANIEIYLITGNYASEIIINPNRFGSPLFT